MSERAWGSVFIYLFGMAVGFGVAWLIWGR